MLAERMIEGDTITTDGSAAVVSLRIPWYRALPLSSVTNVRLSIDGEPITSERIRFQVNGSRYGLADLVGRYDEWWYVLDSAALVIDNARLEPGPHEVDLNLGLYLPYLPAGDMVLVQNEHRVKTLQVEESA